MRHHTLRTFPIVALVLAAVLALTESAQAVVFPDKNLEAALRALVFEKKNNTEELTDDEAKNVEGGLDSRPGSGVLKSTDGGKTWASNTVGGSVESSSVGALVVDPSNPN